MEYIENFRNNLKYLLSSQNYTVTTLAKALDCTRDTIYKWLDGTYQPTLLNACKVAEFFGVTLDELVKE